MLDIGFQELVVLMVIALLVFGPYKLPELGRAIGRAMREFRRASDEFRSTIETNLNINEDSLIPPSSVDTPAVAAREALPTAPADSGLEPPAIPALSDPVPVGAPTPDAEAYGGEMAPASSEVHPDLVDPFCARRGGRLLHRSTCAWVARIPESERLVLKKAVEGSDLGLMRCPLCDPYDADTTS